MPHLAAIDALVEYVTRKGNTLWLIARWRSVEIAQYSSRVSAVRVDPLQAEQTECLGLVPEVLYGNARRYPRPSGREECQDAEYGDRFAESVATEFSVEVAVPTDRDHTSSSRTRPWAPSSSHGRSGGRHERSTSRPTTSTSSSRNGTSTTGWAGTRPPSLDKPFATSSSPSSQ